MTTADHWHKRASRAHLSGDELATIQAARRGLALDPGRHALVAMMAFAHQRTGALNTGRTAAERATIITPGHVDSWCLLGALAHVLGRPEQARRAARRALLLNPADRPATHNLFTALRQAGDWNRAVRAGRRSLVLDPRSDSNAFDLGMLLLSLGRWTEGWPLYDRRLRLKHARPRPDRLPQPFWDGHTDPKLSLAVWGDQNVGDEMQFASLLPEMALRVGHVVLECDPRLVPLFARSFPEFDVVARADPPDPRLTAPSVGAQIPQGHLGRLLRPDSASFGCGPQSWLIPDPSRVADLRARYHARSGGRPLIGIAWKSSNAAFKGKNVPLAQWGSLLREQDALFLSVQYGDVSADLNEARTAIGVDIAHDPEIDALSDLDGFAAQLAATDMVISISNSTIHQACGLGRPAWGILHIRPDWRWGVERDTCPWFPTLRLYRQATRGDWTPVLEAVDRDLRRWLADRPAAC
ncbi:TPR domain protein [alpha proteobacterium BAL199]|jgi:Flp pilus assembly protein TadD|nr:TPR domain protein [alpha proteobacterium BAL199]